MIGKTNPITVFTLNHKKAKNQKNPVGTTFSLEKYTKLGQGTKKKNQGWQKEVSFTNEKIDRIEKILEEKRKAKGKENFLILVKDTDTITKRDGHLVYDKLIAQEASSITPQKSEEEESIQQKNKLVMIHKPFTITGKEDEILHRLGNENNGKISPGILLNYIKQFFTEKVKTILNFSEINENMVEASKDLSVDQINSSEKIVLTTPEKTFMNNNKNGTNYSSITNAFTDGLKNKHMSIFAEDGETLHNQFLDHLDKIFTLKDFKAKEP